MYATFHTGGSMIGEKLYYLNFAKKEISEGIVVAEEISSGGYAVYMLRTDNGYDQVETCLAFPKKELAEKVFKEKMDVASSMEKIEKEAKRTLDSLRVRLIGEPKFKDLIIRR